MDRQRDVDDNDGAAPPAHGKQSEPSMSSRITASASGLARDLFTNASAQDAHAAFTSASGLSAKLPTGSSSSASSTWSEAIPARPNGSSTGSASGGQSYSSEGFRDASIASHQAPDFDFDAFLQGQDAQEYQLTNEPRRTWPDEYQLQNGQPTDDWVAHFQTHGAISKEAPRIDSPWQNQNRNGTTVGHDEYDDGAAVRDILSFPDPTDYEYNMLSESTQEPPSNLFSPNYTPQEQEIVQKIKSSLPTPPQHRSLSQDHPLNLRPEFAADAHTEHALRELVDVLQSEQERAILNDTPVQKEFLADWEDVLTSYADQVWGDMLPIVKEARSQLQEVKSGMNRLDNKAVARLRMILGHVVGAEEVATSVAARSEAALETQGSALGAQENILSQNSQGMARRIGDEMYIDERGYFNPATHQMPNDQQRDQGYQSDGSEESDFDLPTFHCPWISCHEVCRPPQRPLSLR
ncbi:hypothetical protein IWX90DRAFT_103671 [Phyllosticta citrichinensis]|uniref:Uncharacterized protein n=1 Tax=Phyllosticta citrichinensis TaxID=1130410 RepID=A0ABR1Y2H0_9PEZI